ncbi:MAG: cation:proton antiporter [Terrimicrobiaceae bacterium]
MTTFDISVLFFLQLAAILGFCRMVGWLAARLGQPQVVGEMVAGVVLGPSVFGALAPGLQAALFPPDSKPVLFAVCQVGLSIYMFLVGVEFDAGLIRSRFRSAAAVSLSGILVPFALGASAAWFLAGRWPLFSGKTSTWEGMLFLGAAMSITAFPMLARIIFERGLTGTSLGVLALAAGSIDDAAAWCVLAVVMASFSGDPSVAVLAIGGGLAYALAVWLLGVPLFKFLAAKTGKRGGMTHAMLGSTLSLVMLGAWFTDKVGIYAVFGAFILGVAVPKGFFAEALHKHLEKMTTAFLLPLFFIYSGLNTKIGLIIAPNLFGVTLLLLFLAIAGKGVACAAAAWLNGETPREALAIGALMNARGLMELILLNIGLERGIITPTLFTMLVVMAIVTTLMATPAFHFIRRGGPAAEPAP